MVLSDFEIWTSIIIPIFIGPLFIFFKTLYDNNKASKQTKLKLIFDDKLDKIKKQLEQFYWPIYIRLIIIYQLDYNIPDPVNDNKSDSDSSSCYSDNSTGDIETNVCRGYYISENQYYHKCTNKIPINSIAGICKECRWKSCMKKVQLKISDNKKKPEFVSIKLQRSISDWSLKNESQVDIDDELLDSKLEKELEKMDFLNVTIDVNTIELLNKQIMNNYREIQDIIHENISIASPNEKLKTRLVKLLKFIKIEQIIEDSKKTNKENKYKATDFGIKKNTNKVLKMVEKKLYQLTREYRSLLENGPYLN